MVAISKTEIKQKEFISTSGQEEDGRIIQAWLVRLQRWIPGSGRLALTMHREGDCQVLLCFRVKFPDEELVSESKAPTVWRAAQEAGERLENWLAG